MLSHLIYNKLPSAHVLPHSLTPIALCPSLSRPWLHFRLECATLAPVLGPLHWLWA